MGFAVKMRSRGVHIRQHSFVRFLLVSCILPVCGLFACFISYCSTQLVSAQSSQPSPLSQSSRSSQPFLSSSFGAANVNVIEAHNGGQNFQVGQQIDSVLSVQVTSPFIINAHRVTVIDMLPAGLASLRFTGVHWHVTLSASSSPATLIAVYSGPYPIASGSLLPPIILSAIFTASAVPGIVSSVLLGTSDGNKALRIVSTYTVHVFVISPHLTPTRSKIILPELFYPGPTPSSSAIFYPNLPHTGY